MDCFKAKRAQLQAVADRAIQSGAAALADKRSGQKNLFGGSDDVVEDEVDEPVILPEMEEWEERLLLNSEKEVLGYYLTSHPLAPYEAKLAAYCSHKTSSLAGCKDRDRVSMGGMISSMKLSHVKNPRDPNSPTKYVMFDLEDVDGAIRCILWPQDFVKHGHNVKPDGVVVLQGRLDFRGGDEANMIVDKVIPIEELDQSLTHGMKIMIDEQQHGEDSLKNAYEILRGYPGNRQLKIELIMEDGMRVELDSNRRVEINDQLTRRLSDLLGATSVEMLIDRKQLSAKAEPKKRWGGRG
jgi:DNA polymerase-3 subunit alpha